MFVVFCINQNSLEKENQEDTQQMHRYRETYFKELGIGSDDHGAGKFEGQVSRRSPDRS